MGTLTVWHGSLREFGKLSTAIADNCECRIYPYDSAYVCSAHRMLQDQNVLNHLAFVRQQRERIIDGEMKVE